MLHFFGILFVKKTNEKVETIEIKLTQTRLIKRILAVTGLEEYAMTSTSTEITALGKIEQGEPTMERWR